jgi:alkylation response protein AidB-like acyl-CoA dehydrogenase
MASIPRILSHADASAAWTIMFFVLHSWKAAKFEKGLQDELWGDRPYTLMASPLAPTGSGEPVPGGYRISGRWEWATGIMHSDWVFLHALIDRGGTVEPRYLVVPNTDVEVDDVWFTSGMRSTGTNVVRVKDLFVPEHRTVAAVTMRRGIPPGCAVNPEPFYAYPLSPVLSLMGATPAVGAAEACVDLFRERLATRVLAYSGGAKQGEQPASWVRLADAMITARTARVLWDDTIRQLCTAGDARADLTPAERGEVRLAAAHLVRLSRQAITIVCEGSGASVYFEDSPLQRFQRDIEVLKGHVVFDWDRTGELAGKLALGFPPAPTDLI